MSKETEKILRDKKKAQMERLNEAYKKTYDVVYKNSVISDDPAGCKNHPNQSRK